MMKKKGKEGQRALSHKGAVPSPKSPARSILDVLPTWLISSSSSQPT